MPNILLENTIFFFLALVIIYILSKRQPNPLDSFYRDNFNVRDVFLILLSTQIIFYLLRLFLILCVKFNFTIILKDLGFFLVLQEGFYDLALVLSFGFIIKMRGISLKSIAGIQDNLVKTLIIGVSFGVILIVTKLILVFFVSFEIFAKQCPKWWIEEVSPKTSNIMLWGMLIILVGPVIEEMFFRGYLYSIFKSRLNYQSALILCALIWVLVHPLYSIAGAIVLMLMGVIYVSLYQHTKSIIPSLILHIFENSFWFFATLNASIKR